jgi:hypothetical protein
MPYEIIRHSSQLVWVRMRGRLTLEHAERYFRDMWRTLDDCPRSTDLLVDGRHIEGAAFGARQRTEQVVHHPHLGQIAFVVSQHHLLMFAPLMRLVSGISLCATEQEALAYLQKAHGGVSFADRHLGNVPAPVKPNIPSLTHDD